MLLTFHGLKVTKAMFASFGTQTHFWWLADIYILINCWQYCFWVINQRSKLLMILPFLFSKQILWCRYLCVWKTINTGFEIQRYLQVYLSRISLPIVDLYKAQIKLKSTFNLTYTYSFIMYFVLMIASLLYIFHNVTLGCKLQYETTQKTPTITVNCVNKILYTYVIWLARTISK